MYTTQRILVGLSALTAMTSAKYYKTIDNGPVVSIDWDDNKKMFKIDMTVKHRTYLDLIFSNKKAVDVSATSFFGIGNGVIVDKTFVDTENAKIDEESEYKKLNIANRKDGNFELTAFRKSTSD
jgi:hypothetical protein